LEDSGWIKSVRVVVGEVDKPILILAGEVLEGQNTQSRGVVHSTIVMPNQSKNLETKCVHQSHGIVTKASFRPVGLAPKTVTYNLLFGDQRRVWCSVSRYGGSSWSSTPSPTTSPSEPLVGAGAIYQVDNLPKAMKRMSEVVKDTLEKVPCFENQVGAIIIGMEGVEGIEMFDHPKSWEARYKDVMSKYSDTIVKESRLFSIDKEECKKIVEEFINELVNTAITNIINVEKRYKTVKLETEKYVGEYVVLNGKMIHLFAIRKEEDDRRGRRQSVRVGSPTLDTSVTYHVHPQEWRTYRTDMDRWDDGTSDTTVSDIFSKRKGWQSIVNTLREHRSGLTWSELQSVTGLNPTTLSNRLKDGKMVGVITEDVRENGRKVYKLKF